MARLAHQIVNQLTVINLTCYKFRTAFEDITTSLDGDIARLENAVGEMNRLVELLRQVESQSTEPALSEAPTSGAKPHRLPGNVYPLRKTEKARD
jgi:hypothetical protein